MVGVTVFSEEVPAWPKDGGREVLGGVDNQLSD